MGPAGAAGTSPVFPRLVQLSAVQPKKTKSHIRLLVTQWLIFSFSSLLPLPWRDFAAGLWHLLRNRSCWGFSCEPLNVMPT